MKQVILRTVKEILEQNNYQYVEYNHGCFDIIAQNRKMFLIKVVSNVGSFQKEQSNNLKIISSSLDAKAILIGNKTRREKLEDGILYERFGIPTINTNTFRNILENEYPIIYRLRGGLFSAIDKEKLRKGRMKNNMTQEELAKQVGTTKKSIYEHEKTNKLISLDTVEKIEALIEKDIKIPIKMENVSFHTKVRPGTKFEERVGRNLKRVGFETAGVGQAPFNIIAKERFMVLSEAETNEKKIERNIPCLEQISNITNNKVIVITDENREYVTPTVEIEELEDMEQSKDLKKKLK